MKKSKVFYSIFLVTIILATAIAGSSAYFSDNETSQQNVLQAGAIDLKIDNTSYYNGKESPSTTWELDNLTDNNHLFFNFNDLKPGDWGEDTISAHVKNNDSWLCMDITLTGTPENGQTEPESLVDETDGEQEGELQNYLSFVFWADDGDNVLETDETDNIFIDKKTIGQIGTVALADSTINIWTQQPGNPLEGGDVGPIHYIGKAWCFGELTINAVEPGNNSPIDNPGIECSGSTINNDSQTDQVLADVSFTAVQSRNNETFKCIGCEESGQGYASTNVSYTPGTRKDGSAIAAPRNDPTRALGAPNGTFVSLGFGGEIVLALPSYITGNNVTTFEITNGTYPDEKADVYVSEDNANWYLAGEAYNKDPLGKSIIDVSILGLNEIKYIKLVDKSNIASFSDGNADGYDLDSIGTTICLDEVN